MAVSIVTGNGFDGHAQRVENEYGLENTSYYMETRIFDFSFQYRSSHAITGYLIGDRPAATGSAQTFTLNDINGFDYEGANFQVFSNEETTWYETSTSNVSVPTSHPTSKTLTVSTGQAYSSGQYISVNSQYANVNTTVVSYNSGTGELVLNSTSSSGSGTFVSWTFSWGNFPPYGTASSTTSNTIPTSHPTQLTFTIETGKSGLTAGTVVSVTATYISFYGTITAYNSGTGQITMDSAGNTGSGSSSNWNVQIWEDVWWEVGKVNLVYALLPTHPIGLSNTGYTNKTSTSFDVLYTMRASDASTTVEIEYATTAYYNANGQTFNQVTESASSPVSGNAQTSITTNLVSLTPSTSYTFRAKLTNAYGTFYSGVNSTTTNA